MNAETEEVRTMRTRRFLAAAVTGGAFLLAIGGTVSFAKPFIVGTPGNDTITGTDRHDFVNARAGDDVVTTLAGWDLVFAGRGNDTVHAGLGPDLIVGGRDDDTLYGDDGRDRIFAQQGVDTEYGGEGADDLWAMARTDVTGDPNEPADTLDGGPGNDRFHVRDGEADHIVCGAGLDVVLADFKDVVSADCEIVKRHTPRHRARGRGERCEGQGNDKGKRPPLPPLGS
jgi:Ca2+-binding RTX toxin-like protein